MFKLQPDIIGFLSDSILKHRYNPPSYVLNKNVEKFCMHSKSINIYRTFLVNQRYIINCIIVDTVLNSLDSKQAQFVIYKYKHNQTLTWISAKLDISARTIQNFQQVVQECSLTGRGCTAYQNILAALNIQKQALIGIIWHFNIFQRI